ncbi:hypothetical protein [Natronomonas sp. LN261]|uniref:DUF7521 family protein n=1 Tax=Natronomonas sp. LN261 TaxID=2750669 RepID=UPI0015EE9E1F|nr:hypothetical protein [Natronomonas sp. LN261]
MVHSTTDFGIRFTIVVTKTLIFLVGGVVTYLAFSAYRRTNDRSLGFLTAGFGLIVIGVLLAGFTFELLNVTFRVGVLIESLFILSGLSIIAYSLRVP